MKEKATPKVEHAKPCVCRVIPQAGFLWKPTGEAVGQRPAEMKCRLCGRTITR
jgi:hypothetical protein